MTTGTVGTFAIGTIGVPSTVLRDPPVVTITAPVGTVATSTTTVTWTYVSPLSRPQLAFRVILSTSGSIVYDSGIVAGDDTSFALSYVLSPFTTYSVLVGVSDGLDGDLNNVFSGGWATSVFFTEFSETAVYPDETKVGSVYEIAINGQGYMLEDNPERPVKRQTVQLTPERFATGDTPFDEAIDRYNIIGHSDWVAGEGQTYLSRPGSDDSRYSYSEWINPFETGEISLNRTPDRHIASTYVGAVDNVRAVVASGSVYVQTANAQLTERDTPGGANTAFSTGLAGTINGLASDGNNWYASDGATIRRNTVAVDPAADWSTVDVTEIAWCVDRLAGLDTAAVPPNFTTFTPAGAEELAGGWQAFAGATLRGLAGGDGHIWFGVNYNTTGHVRAWPMSGGAGDSFIALTLPEGETVDGLYFYLGNVFLATHVAGTVNKKVYRCVASEGRLTPEFITELTGGLSTPWRVSFAGRDRFVAFTWHNVITVEGEGPTGGIGVIDLESGGYARWQAGGEPGVFDGAAPSAVVNWGGDFGFVLTGSGADAGFFGMSNDPQLHEGFLETSVDDLGSNFIKVLDQVSITTRPLAGTVEVLYSTNTNDSFVSVGTMSGAGRTTVEFPMAVFGSSIGLKIVLNPAGTAGPVVKIVAAKTHPKGVSDQVITFPINCGDTITGLNGVELRPDSGPGKGITRVRTLESFIGQTVKLQDVDWPQTGSSDLFQVVSADADLTGAFDRNKTYRVDHGTLTITMRRAVN